MTDISISVTDLRALLDVTEGYASEHGLESVTRYAVPAEVSRAVANAKAAISRSDRRASEKIKERG